MDTFSQSGSQQSVGGECPKSLSPPEMFYVIGTLGEAPWLEGENVLVSAGVAWRNPGSNGQGEGFDMNIPDAETLFIDSGGFQVVKYWDSEYPYSTTEMFEWAESIEADYVAGRDWACLKAETMAEKFDHIEADEVRPLEKRIRDTWEAQEEQYEIYKKGDYSFQFVPVLQGYEVDDYRRQAYFLSISDLPKEFVAIGTTCKRDHPDKTRKVLQRCFEQLPHSEFHLFGATKKIFKDQRFWDRFRSGDTHSWGRKMPNGDWTRSKADKPIAFEGYASDIQEVAEKVNNQSSLDSFGTDPPHYKQRFKCENCGAVLSPTNPGAEGGCRHCQRTLFNFRTQILEEEGELPEG